MIKQNNLFLCVSVVLVTTSNLCLSKPTTSPGIDDNNSTELNRILKTSVNEIIETLGDNGVANIISSKDSDYRSIYAAQMLSYMNRSEYPCNDFYEYACGNWKNVIDERMAISKRNNILDIAYKLADIVESLLQRPHINDVAPEYAKEFELAKQFYDNCLEAELHPLKASSEYLAVLKEIGGFPAVEADWNGDNFDWLKMSAHLSNYGIKNLVNEAILPGYPFPPYFKIPDFGFDIELHYDTIENTSSNAYIENTKRVHDILTTYEVEDSRIDGIITETFDFLKKILKVKQQFNQDDYECTFLSSFMEDSKVAAVKEKWRTYHEIAWLGKNFENATDEFEECCTPCFFLYEKIDQICRENKQAAANYLSLKFIFHLDARLKDTKFQKDFCILNIKSAMKYFFDHLYMKVSCG